MPNKSTMRRRSGWRHAVPRLQRDEPLEEVLHVEGRLELHLMHARHVARVPEGVGRPGGHAPGLARSDLGRDAARFDAHAPGENQE